MLRFTTPDDSSVLVTLAAGTGVFKPLEIDTLAEVLDDYHAVCQTEYGHLACTLTVDEVPAGFVYLAPVAMTDRTWEIWWIVVDKNRQGQGLGQKLLAHAEQQAAEAGGRILFIETSSLPHYEPTRRFYRKHGYTLAGQLPDFYAAGDDKVIFRKPLIAPVNP
ncbi:MAG: GNAT family N-acetyltransferase [Bacteroidales bacterium]|nr:GNAT family N-acetyltransferase [Bacteroidales bacterium]